MGVALSTADRLGGRDGRRGRESRRDAGIRTHFRTLRFEPMEERALLSADVQFHHIVFDPATGSTSQQVAPLAVVSSMTPAQIRTAYGINQIAGDGAGQTIAIVDAYDNPNVAGDLQVFSSTYGLPTANFTKLNQYGLVGSYPVGDTGWGVEIAMDVQWAHAVAPGASIILVEANSDSFSDLLTAVDTARNYSGVSVVSMSWGSSGEFSGETSYDSHFTTPSGHTGVTFLASTGDSGWPGGYPAYSPTVVAVGGTTLSINTSTYAYSSETGWSGSGGGISQYENQPSYQNGVVTQSTTKRTIPDVAFDADPYSGVSVYDTYGYSGWLNVGGTSLSAPCWAGLIAIANQLRVAQGLSTLNGPSNPTQTHALLYGLAGTPGNYNPSGDYHDVTSGSNGHSQSAVAGYDLVTGIGSPVANLLVAALAPNPGPPPTTIYSANMDANPGWTYQGQWAWGQPTGGSGDRGGPDPTSGHTGSNVVGYNLAGGYVNNMTTTYWTTTTAIDCSAFTGVTLDFWRWLGVDQSSRDHAYVQVSNNGTTWTTVWQNSTSNLNETAWSEQTYDISAVANRQSTVYIRWGMGTTNVTRTYCGWNIDDVTLTGTPVADTTPPTVSGLMPNPTTVADANVGTAGFALTVAFNEAMNTAVAPTVAFPVENPAGTLTFNSLLSVWTNGTTYVARYDVADLNVKLQNVDVRVTGAKDAAGNTQNQADFADLFGIDTQNPAVTVNQAAGQLDPTNASPVNFTVVFSEAVGDFAAGDVMLGGTAGATTAVATNPSGDHINYNVAVGGMTAQGSVIVSLAAGVAHDVAGNPNTASASTDNTVTYDPIAPTVVNVVIGSGAWSGSFVDYLAAQNGMNVGGYSVPVGSGAQLLPLPWTNIDRINVAFSENVVVGQMELTLVGVNTTQYAVGSGTFSYDPSSFTATWTLAQPIAADKLLLCLNAGGASPITDLAGNRLDGEWTNPPGTTPPPSTYPSGNGVAGGDFLFRFNVLPGDATQDGYADANDLAKVLANYNQLSGMTWTNGDFNGDGAVDSNDLAVLSANYNQSLPALEPVAPTPAAPVGQMANAVALTWVNLQPIVSEAVANELDHVAGFRDIDRITDNLMSGSPKRGVRRQPALCEVDAVFAELATLDGQRLSWASAYRRAP